MQVTITFHNHNPGTIWNRLSAKLGREPTHAEASAEVRRIMRAAVVDNAAGGKLPHQR